MKKQTKEQRKDNIFEYNSNFFFKSVFQSRAQRNKRKRKIRHKKPTKFRLNLENPLER